MPLVNMKPLLRDAMDNGYAVAAFNLVDYGTTKAMVQAAEELNAPVICQTSTKTIQYWSHKEIVSWVRTVAEDSPVPVVLHLDHCKDLAMIEACAKAGWTSIMIDASHLPFEENLEQSLRTDPGARVVVSGERAELAKDGAFRKIVTLRAGAGGAITVKSTSGTGLSSTRSVSVPVRVE